MARHKIGGLGLLTAAAISATALAACPAGAQELSPEMKAVVAEANKEGTLKVIWPGNLLGGARGLATIEQNVNKMFGSQVKMSHTPTGSLIQLGFQIANEAKANTPAGTDVYIAVANVLPMLTQNKLLVAVPWQKLLPGRITDRIVELDGAALKLASTMYGVTYNTKLLPNVPRTLEGFLAPGLKGKLATNPQGVGFDVLAANEVMGREKTLDYAKRFSAQVAGLINCTDQNRVGTGEFVAMMFDCGPIDAIKMKEAGLPVDQVLLKDHTTLSYFYGAIPANAAHPNAAKLLIAYLVTEEGQRLQWELWREDLHLLPGSKLAERLDAAIKDGSKPLEVNASWYANHPEVDATRPDLLKIIREGR
jgi:ABC-type Fe3+ transport system substrate-binding protein